MTQADQYRARAAELSAKARSETNPALKAEIEALALGHLRLAEQADRNSRNDMVYETPLERSNVQQPQTKSKDEPGK